MATSGTVGIAALDPSGGSADTSGEATDATVDTSGLGGDPGGGGPAGSDDLTDPNQIKPLTSASSGTLGPATGAKIAGGIGAGTVGEQALSTGAGSGGGTSGLSATPDQNLDSILPLLQSGQVTAAPQDVFQLSEFGGTQYEGVDPSSLAADPTFAGLGANPTVGATGSFDTGVGPGEATFLGEFSPTSATANPTMGYLYGQSGDKTTSVDQLRSELETPAWDTYNQIIKQYPQLAGQEINPDYLAAALRGSQYSTGGIDPESNLPAFEGELQDLLLNQPGVVAARGGYEDASATPAEIAAGSAQAQANTDYMNKYGDETPWQGTKQGLETAAAIAASYFGGEYFAGLAADAGGAGAAAGAGAGAGISDAAAGTGAFAGGGAAGLGADAYLTPEEAGLLAAGEGAGGQAGLPTWGAGLADIPNLLESAGGLFAGTPALGDTAGTAGAFTTGDIAGGAGGTWATPFQADPMAGAFTTGDITGETTGGAVGSDAGLTAESAGLGPQTAAPTAADISPTEYYGGQPTPAATTMDPLGAGAGLPADSGFSALSAASEAAGGVDPSGLSAPLGSDNFLPESYPSGGDTPSAADLGGGGPDSYDQAFYDQPDTTPLPDQPAGPLDTSPSRGLNLPTTTSDNLGDVPQLTGQGARLPGAGTPSAGGGGLNAPGSSLPTSLANAGGAASGPGTDWWGMAKDIGKWGALGGPPVVAMLSQLQQKKAMQNAVNQLQQSTAPATGTGTTLLSDYSAGNLPAGQQAALDQWAQGAKASIRQQYASAGQADSTAEKAAEAYVDQSAEAQKATQLNTMLQSGLEALQLGSSGTQAAVNTQLQGDQQLLNEINTFMQAYGNILRGNAVTS